MNLRKLRNHSSYLKPDANVFQKVFSEIFSKHDPNQIPYQQSFLNCTNLGELKQCQMYPIYLQMLQVLLFAYAIRFHQHFLCFFQNNRDEVQLFMMVIKFDYVLTSKRSWFFMYSASSAVARNMTTMMMARRVHPVALRRIHSIRDRSRHRPPCFGL